MDKFIGELGSFRLGCDVNVIGLDLPHCIGSLHCCNHQNCRSSYETSGRQECDPTSHDLFSLD